MHDAARALQFVRSKAAEWNIDARRIALCGASAGACTSLWLAFHDDLADPTSADPVARESTRPFCAAVQNAQTSLDPQVVREWTPNSNYGGNAFGFMDPRRPIKTYYTRFSEFLAAREKVLDGIREYSPIEQVSADDPPVYLFYDDFVGSPALGRNQKDPTHSANFGLKLVEKLQRVGVPCELVYPGGPATPHRTMQDYLMEKLLSR
jgi:acetyl esterase/lipase